jgi:hypothetical protein
MQGSRKVRGHVKAGHGVTGKPFGQKQGGTAMKLSIHSLRDLSSQHINHTNHSNQNKINQSINQYPILSTLPHSLSLLRKPPYGYTAYKAFILIVIVVNCARTKNNAFIAFILIVVSCARTKNEFYYLFNSQLLFYGSVLKQLKQHEISCNATVLPH